MCIIQIQLSLGVHVYHTDFNCLLVLIIQTATVFWCISAQLSPRASNTYCLLARSFRVRQAKAERVVRGDRALNRQLRDVAQPERVFLHLYRISWRLCTRTKQSAHNSRPPSTDNQSINTPVSTVHTFQSQALSAATLTTLSWHHHYQISLHRLPLTSRAFTLTILFALW